MRPLPLRRSVSANAARGAGPASGHDAATAATDGSAVTACTIAFRVGSFAIWTTTVSEVRIPESNVVAANALLRNTAAEISSSADALTCRPIRKFRARPGRASLTTSPRIVLIGSMRVACSAGASPKAMVETPAPTMRNSSTRQSASGTNNRKSPISGGQAGHHRVDDHLERHARDREAGRGGHQRKQQALRQQLADDAAAGGAK